MDVRGLKAALNNISREHNVSLDIIADNFQNYATNKLLYLIKQLEHDDDIAFDIKSFLTEIAQFYQLRPELSYNFLPRSYLNQACFAVATFLQPILGINRYQLIMPQLQVLTSQVTATDLTMQDLPFHEFVQVGDRFIEVFLSLFFATSDGILKHTTLFNDYPQALNANEIELIVKHSDFTSQYWQAIQKKVNHEMQGTSFGAALTRLVDGLFEGGVFATGQYDVTREENAASSANEAIAYFGQWLEALTEHERETIMQCSDGFSWTMKNVWGRLSTPLAKEYIEEWHCVNNFQYIIKSILKNNPQLFNQYPVNVMQGLEWDMFETDYKKLEERVQSSCEQLSKAMAENNYTPTYSLPISEEEKNKFTIKLFAQQDFEQFASVDAVKRLLYSDPTLISYIWRTLRASGDNQPFEALLRSKTLPPEHSFKSEDTDYLSLNRHNRYFTASRKVGHAVIMTDVNDEETALQFHIPAGIDERTPHFVPLKEVEKIERFGVTGYRAKTDDDDEKELYATRFLEGNYDEQPFKIACFSPIPVHNERFWGSETDSPLFDKKPEYNTQHFKAGFQLEVEPWSVQIRQNERNDHNNAIMGESARDAYENFLDDHINELTPQMQAIFRRAINASFEGLSSQGRPEWLHAEPTQLASVTTDTQQKDNLGAAPKWVNTEMMVLSHIVKWFALNRPESMQEIRPRFEMLLDSELIKRINYDISIEEHNHIVNLFQTINPFRQWPLVRKATDLTQATAVVYSMLNDIPPVSTMSIFTEKRGEKRKFESDEAEQSEKKRARIERK